MIEVKMTRNDFYKDLSKPFRHFHHRGMGEFKYYLCPTGVIDKEDLLNFWGLLWIDEKGKITIQQKAQKYEANLECERTVLLSLLRREKNSNSYGIVRWHENKHEDVVCVNRDKAQEYVEKYNKLAGKEEYYVDDEIWLPLSEV